VPLGIVCACIVMLVLCGWTIRRQIRAQLRVDDAHTDFLLSVLGGLHTVKGLAMEKLLTRRYENIQEQRVGSARDLELSATAVTDMTAFFGQIAVVGIASIGALMVIDGELTVGALAACTLLSGRAFQPLQAAIAYWSKSQSVNAARERLRQTFDLPLRADAQAGNDGPDELPSGAVTLKDVGLRFGADGDFVFRHVDLELAPGEMVAITGPNGHGKSSLLSLIAGMQSPTEGELLLDGKPLSAWNRQTLEKAIAYVPQHDALFSGTILDNITAFRPELTDRAQEIADLLGFAAHVRALPHGFGTQVGAGAGERVPGGLAQRIILARSMVDDPKVLLLDAAYTAMDYEGDKAMKTLLQHLKGRSTIVLVTHRPSFMWLADRVHDLSDGVFETSGLHVKSLKSSVGA
jgi:ATP-binding cassette, subfamily C, bacterial LapB